MTEFSTKTESQSKRMRKVLNLLYKQDNEGFSDFESYYNSKMYALIEVLKSKLNG